MGHKLIKVEDVFRLVEVTKHGNQIIGTTDLDYQKAWSDRCEKLSLKQCQAIELGYDLDELACNEIRIDISVVKHIDAKQKENSSPCIPLNEGGCVGSNLYNQVKGFEKGFQKALEILGDKKFSEGDVMLGWDAGVMSQAICDSNYFGFKRQEQLNEHKESYQKNLKPASLQQTEWDVEVEMEPYHDGEFIEDGKTHVVEPKFRPVLDADGYLIFKKK